jgi:hypothetical protein
MSLRNVHKVTNEIEEIRKDAMRLIKIRDVLEAALVGAQERQRPHGRLEIRLTRHSIVLDYFELSEEHSVEERAELTLAQVATHSDVYVKREVRLR